MTSWLMETAALPPPYNEWQVSLSKKLLGLDWSLAYVDSNLSNDECASYNGFDDVCGSNLVLGVSKSF